MQGKGIIKFFLIVLGIVCLLQYLYLVPTRKVEKAADEYAAALAAEATSDQDAQFIRKEARVRYLDSMSSEKVVSIPLLADYTYEELKSKQLNFGLDLKGGLAEVLQVDLKDFIRTLSKDSKDPTFLAALDAAEVQMRSAQSDFVTLFAEEWTKVADGKKLASIFARNTALKGEITFDTEDTEVIRLLRKKADETVDLTYKRLKDRIDKFGVTQPNVSLDKNRDLILIELPGVENTERARKYLQASAKLEFWDVYRIDNTLLGAFAQADRKLEALMTGDTSVVEDKPEFRLDTIYEPVTDTNGVTIDSTMRIDTVDTSLDPFANRGPLLNLLQMNAQGGQLQFPLHVVGVADKNKKDAINQMMAREEIASLFPSNVRFHWSYKSHKDYESGEDTGQYLLHAIKLPKGSEKAPLEGDHVVRATSSPDPTTGQVQVSLSMDQVGAQIWGKMTTDAFNDQNREIAIMLDDEVVSAPRVNQPIPSGNSSISGDFSIQEGQDLANILEVGKLPAQTHIIQETLVGPSLGQENINRSFKSLMIGFLLVLVFMMLYYSTGGIVAIIALFANLFFIFGALSSLGTVLTLPGIAGIVLTIGMAVDANVIIFERIREELRNGKSMIASISDGFKYSYSAIIDANVTTILVAIVLAYFGLGPIKGFAVVLIIGVISSLITAVLLGRMTIDWWTGKGKAINFWNNTSKNWLANLNIDWLGKKKMTYVISGIIVLVSLASIVTRGFEFGVDFKGGYSYNIEFDESKSFGAEDIRSSLSDVLGESPIVKAIDIDNTFNITTSYLIDDNANDAQERVTAAIYEGLNNLSGGDIDEANFIATDGTGTHLTSSSKVGPTIADDIKDSSVKATLFALLLIFLYIFLRFSKWQYSLGAVGALFHDTIIVMGVFSLFHGIFPFSMEIDQAFIAALLTTIGYSINDTVVVFDRIREFLGIHLSKTKKEVVNMAINSTVSRTIITSVTTLFVVLILFLFGGSSIKGFAFALLIGIIVGTYSSIFIATPIVFDMTEDLKPIKKERKGKPSYARKKA
jgi:SecD/SecF fusion protein